jgi:hypothetical protein
MNWETPRMLKEDFLRLMEKGFWFCEDGERRGGERGEERRGEEMR